MPRLSRQNPQFNIIAIRLQLLPTHYLYDFNTPQGNTVCQEIVKKQTPFIAYHTSSMLAHSVAPLSHDEGPRMFFLGAQKCRSSHEVRHPNSSRKSTGVNLLDAEAQSAPCQSQLVFSFLPNMKSLWIKKLAKKRTQSAIIFAGIAPKFSRFTNNCSRR